MYLTEVMPFVPPQHRPATTAQLEDLREEVAELKARLDAITKSKEQ